MILDPDAGHHGSRIPPERRLIASVISRAVLDLFSKVMLTSNNDEAAVVKRDAMLFLTASGGPWAKRRRDLCVAVDMCPDKVRRNVIEVLEGRDVVLIDDRHAFNDIAAARAMWNDQARREQAAHEARVAQAEVARQRKAHEAAMKAEREAHDTERNAVARLHQLLGDGPVTRVCATLINGPLTIRQMGFALNGDLDSSVIRVRLLKAQKRGIVAKDGAEWRLLDLKECLAA